MFFQGGKDTKKARSFVKKGGLCFINGSKYEACLAFQTIIVVEFVDV